MRVVLVTLDGHLASAAERAFGRLRRVAPGEPAQELLDPAGLDLHLIGLQAQHGEQEQAQQEEQALSEGQRRHGLLWRSGLHIGPGSRVNA